MFNLKKEFIYIKHKDLTLEEIYRLAKKLELSCFAFWLYPETHIKLTSFLKNLCTVYKKLEPVTIYDEKKYVKNFLVLLEKKSLNYLYKKIGGVESVDSIAFYKTHKKKWVMCIIPHENNQVIIKYSKKAEEILYKMNIEFTTIPPDGW